MSKYPVVNEPKNQIKHAIKTNVWEISSSFPSKTRYFKIWVVGVSYIIKQNFSNGFGVDDLPLFCWLTLHKFLYKFSLLVCFGCCCIILIMGKHVKLGIILYRNFESCNLTQRDHSVKVFSITLNNIFLHAIFMFEKNISRGQEKSSRSY